MKHYFGIFFSISLFLHLPVTTTVSAAPLVTAHAPITTPVRRLEHHTTVASAAYSPDGKCIVTTTYAGDPPQIWDAVTGKKIGALGRMGATSAAYSPDGDSAMTRSFENERQVAGEYSVRLWDVPTCKERWVLKVDRHKELDIESASYSPDSKYVTIALNSRTFFRAIILDAANGEQLRVLVHPAIVRSVAYSPDGKYVITGSEDLMVRTWDVTTGKLLETKILPDSDKYREQLNRRFVSCFVSYSPDGKHILALWEGSARIWDVATGEELLVLPGDQISPMYSPDGKYIVHAVSPETAQILDAATGKELGVLGGHKDIRSAAFSPDGNFVITTSGFEALIWDLRTYLDQPGSIISEGNGHLQDRPGVRARL